MSRPKNISKNPLLYAGLAGLLAASANAGLTQADKPTILQKPAISHTEDTNKAGRHFVGNYSATADDIKQLYQMTGKRVDLVECRHYVDTLDASFDEKERETYKKHSMLALEDLKKLGIIDSARVVPLFDIHEPKTTSQNTIYIVKKKGKRCRAVGEDFGFDESVDTFRPTLNTDFDLKYQPQTLFISTERMGTAVDGPSKEMDIYQSVFLTLAYTNLIPTALDFARSTHFSGMMNYSKSLEDKMSLDAAAWLNEEVVSSEIKGLWMQRGPILGISKEDIIKVLHDPIMGEGLMKHICMDPKFRKALIGDYKKNPKGVWLKLKDLEKNKIKKK